MTAMPTNSRPMQTARLDRTLEYAVIQSWDELMPASPSGLIHIDYQTGPDGSLDFVKIWASTFRGQWNLICELWTRAMWSHAAGLSFCADRHSAQFARTLELVMERQNAFSKLPDQQGLIQVFPPTPEDRREAERWMSVAFDHEGSTPPMEQPVAA